MNITVYLGASSGNDPTLETSVRALGRLIGKSGNALVYGGSKNGLMGALAESVLRAGGEVTGVEPQFFIDKGYEYDEITTLIVTHDPEEALTLSDKVLIIDAGRIAQYDTPYRIVHAPAGDFIRSFILRQLAIKRDNIFRLFALDPAKAAELVATPGASVVPVPGR